MTTALLILAGILVALIAVMMVAGSFLPGSHTAARSAVFHHAPAELYAVASDFASTPAWRSGLQSVEMLPAQNGRISYREFSRRRAVTYLVTENAPGKKLVLKMIGDDLPFGGTWTIEFSPAPEGARVRIQEQGEIKNPAFRFLARYVFGYTASMDGYLRDLGRKFGETVTPEPAN